MLSWEKITLRLRTPFRLSYGSSEERIAHWVRINGDEGWGEGTIPSYYGISDAALEDSWRRVSNRNLDLPEHFEQIFEWVDPEGPAPARCAIDLALHDRIAKKDGLPLWKAMNLPRPKPKASSYTISLDTPESMAATAAMIKDYPIIKVKLGGGPQDMERLRVIRAARPDARLFVDANAGWNYDEALACLGELENIGLELLEQPLAKDDLAGMGQLQQQTSIPVVADESMQAFADVDRLAAAGIGGINLKLMKTGGITPTLKMIHRAREHGLKIMLGCMIETAIGITAMSHLSGFADWLDLDSSLLVINDPFEGMMIDSYGLVQVPDRPGIGVQHKVDR